MHILANAQVRECFIVLALFIGSLLTAMQYLEATPRGSYYQNYFAPAVNLACGKGFVEPTDEKSRPDALKDFLELKIDNFSCEKLLDGGVYTDKSAVRPWFYMLSATATVWMITGISWTAVNYLLAILFSISICASYGIFRFFMSSPFALLGSFIFSQSVHHLSMLPHLRDYAKAPFILLGIFLIGQIIKTMHNKGNYFLPSFGLGGMLGVGFGFRPDVLILFLPSVLAVLIFFEGNFFKTLHRRIAIIGLIFVTFWIIALPMLTAFRSELGTCHWHFATLGLSPHFAKEMNLKPAPYDTIYGFNDSLADMEIVNYGNDVLHMPGIRYCSPEYDEASRARYIEIVKTFPADIISRAYASTLKIAADWWMLFDFGSVDILNMVIPVLKIGYFITAIPLAIGLILADIRIAIFILVVVVYLFGYPALQFHPRHFFHLFGFFWIPLGAFGSYVASAVLVGPRRKILIESCLELFKKKRELREQDAEYFMHPAIRLLVFAVSATAIIWVPLSVARMIQAQNVSTLIHNYSSATSNAIQYKKSAPNSLGRVLLEIPETIFGDENETVKTREFLRIRISNIGCTFENNSKIFVKYAYQSDWFDFSRNLQVPVPTGSDTYVDLYQPAYLVRMEGKTQTRLSALEMSESLAECPVAIDQISTSEIGSIIVRMTVPETFDASRYFEEIDLADSHT